MQGESVERELMIAGRAVAQGLISESALAAASKKWAEAGAGNLLACLEETSGLDDMDRQQLRSLFAGYHDSLVGQIAESLDDSIFGKLNNALAGVADEGLKASVVHWQEIVRARSTEKIHDSDRFEIIAAHAQGGLGEVLLADDRQLNRQVALKRIRDKWADNEHARIRFQLEAEVTGRLEHPGVVPVYALGTRDDGQIFYAMRFIRGESLESAIDNFHTALAAHPQGFRSADFRNLIRRFIDVCNTISYAHNKGIIHRDLKPANIMLGKYGETLVVDWGLAKQVDVHEVVPEITAESIIQAASGSGSAPTQFGSAVGTPQYMSPEQATGQLDRMGPATDVFGLGATLYHILTRQPPQPQDSVDRILDRVEHGDFPKPCDVNSAVPGPLEAICLKAMALRSSERYSSPARLAEDLDRWLADEPISVYSDSPAVRIARWARKNQTLATASVAALVLMLVSTIGISFAWSRIQQMQFEAQKKLDRRNQEAQAKSMAQLRLKEAARDYALNLAQQHINDSQFETAADVLANTALQLQGDPEFIAERNEMAAQAVRLGAIAEFYKLAEDAQRANYLAEDEDEILSTMKALKLMGVWDHADWWNHIPGDDLNAEQRDHLRQTIYKQLSLIASTYTKLTGLRTLEGVGGVVPETVSGRLEAVLGKGGKDEARATLKIIDLANRFRYAESLRWFRGIAGMRLLKSYTIPSRWLKSPRNSADAYEMGVLTLTNYIVGNLPIDNYRGVSDPLVSARETIGIASEMQPDHFWTHLLLAQSEYLQAERETERGNEKSWTLYESSRQIFTHCIALRPESPFAWSDISSVCLREHEVIARDTSLTESDRERIRADLLDSCIDNAFHAVTLAPDEPWVYWHYGHALEAIGKVDEAMEAYSKAIQMGHKFSDNRNEELVDHDRIRGRERLFDVTQERIDAGDDRPIFHAVFAATCYSSGEPEAARMHVKTAMAADHVPPLAWAVSGWLAREDQQNDQAFDCFAKCLAADADSLWSVFGQAVCEEEAGNNEAALELFRRAEQLAETKPHKADAFLGQCRTLMRMGLSSQAGVALTKADQAYPACSLVEIEKVAAERNDRNVKNILNELKPISTADLVGNSAIVNCADVPVLNGDFELRFGKYWSSPNGPTWQVYGDGNSVASRILLPDSSGEATFGVLEVKTESMGPGSYASTRQTITVQQQATYRVELDAMVQSAQVGGLLVFVTPEDGEFEDPVIRIDRLSANGREDSWLNLVGTFRTPRSRRFPVLMPMTLHLVSEGPVDVLIDNIRITLVGED